MIDTNQPIGVFDSGIGGLTVLESLRSALPCENYIFLGDTARVPYGNKSAQTIIRYALACTQKLVSRGVKAIVIACNTASAYAVDAVKETFDIPVIGVIDPVSQVAARTTHTGCVGIIGTRATISSGAYVRAIQSVSPNIRVIGKTCPLFVPLVEEGWAGSKVADMVIREYLRALLDSLHGETLDTLILGCTHYPVLKLGIAAALNDLGQNVTLCECGHAAANALKPMLQQASLLRTSREYGRVVYLVTDDPAQFISVGRSFMHEPPAAAEHIDI